MPWTVAASLDGTEREFTVQDKKNPLILIKTPRSTAITRTLLSKIVAWYATCEPGRSHYNRGARIDLEKGEFQVFKSRATDGAR
jgi:hypothetical protein